MSIIAIIFQIFLFTLVNVVYMLCTENYLRELQVHVSKCIAGISFFLKRTMYYLLLYTHNGISYCNKMLVFISVKYNLW